MLIICIPDWKARECDWRGGSSLGQGEKPGISLASDSSFSCQININARTSKPDCRRLNTLNIPKHFHRLSNDNVLGSSDFLCLRGGLSEGFAYTHRLWGGISGIYRRVRC